MKGPWLVPGGLPLALTAWTGLENTPLTLIVGGWFLARKAAWALSENMTIESADYFMFVNEWARSRSRV